MDPNANLQEQEHLLTHRSSDRTVASDERTLLHDLRKALWAWLRKGGFEPRWSECPRARQHFLSYGGSNVR